MKSPDSFWQETYNRCSPRLLSMCRRYVKNLPLAEDLMHDGFIRAIDKYPSYQSKGVFDGWLRKIVLNEVLMHIRRSDKFSFKSIEDDDNWVDELGSEVEESKQNIIQEAEFSPEELQITIDELPDHYKVVFNLYVQEGYTHNEISDMIKITVGTSKSYLARARKKLVDLLYEKALKRKRSKRRIVAAMLLIPNVHFIDKLYENAFGEHFIQPTHVEQFKLELPEYTTRSWSIFTPAQVAGYILISGGVFFLAGFLTFKTFFLPKVNKQGLNKTQTEKTFPLISDTISQVTVPSIKNITSTKSNSSSKKNYKKKTGDSTLAHTPKPVVKTITIKDTVKIFRKKRQNEK